MKERTKLLIIGLTFAAAYYIPWAHETIRQSGFEAFMMLQEYAREHVLTCLVPAFFIAGAIAVFVSQASVLKYFGAQARKIVSYSVAVAESGLSVNITKVSDTMEIAKHGVFGTPAVVMDGEVESVGNVPTKGEIKVWLKT
jgi:Na+/H+-dicarboxylate symporter